MAENTETYKVVIDTEVQGQDNIELLNRTVKTSIGEFDNLNEAIGKTQDTLGKVDPKSKEFKDLSKELQGLKDRLKETEVNSLRFTEALAAQPGVAGLVGQSLEGLRGTMKVFMANPIIALLAGITAAFVALKESLSRTEEGQAKLNQISEAFTKIMNGLFAVIEPIAMMIADLVIELLSSEKVMKVLSTTVGVLTGTFTALFGIGKELVGFVVNNFVNAFKTLTDVAGSAGKVLKGVFTFDLELIKEGLSDVGKSISTGFDSFVDNAKNTASGIGTAVVDGVNKGFESGANAFKEGAKRLTEEEKEAAKKAEEERKKLAEESAKKADEARKKKEEEDKKQREEQKKLLDEANKILVEQYIQSLESRDAEEYKRGLLFNEQKAKLIAAGITDFTLLEENYRKDIAAINQKFDEEEDAKEKERLDKIKEIQKAEFDERLLGLENELAVESISFDKRRELIAQKEALLLQQEDLTQQQRVAIARAASNEIMAIDMAELDAKAEIQNAYLDLAGQFGSLLQQIAGKNKKVAIAGIIIEQAASIGKIIANTALANAKAVAALPLTGGLPFTAINTISAGLSIASTIAGAAKAIKQINSSDSASAPASAPSLSVGGGVSAPQVGGVTPPQITGVEGGNNPTAQIASTLAARTEQPVRAYVVERDISSSQAMSRRTSKAASFG
jgi:hypothetical protein